MILNYGNDIHNFFVIGINYQKTNAALRGQFAIHAEQHAAILTRAAALQLHDVFVLSTCNRTEIYGFAAQAEVLINLLCSETEGTKDTFMELAYIKNGMQALTHLFYVGAGLDSQIPGDYEIIGQLKQSVQFAKERGGVTSFLERIINFVIQASKSVKNETCLSSGTVSVSFAAVQFIRQQMTDISGKRIVLLGAGKIGRITCRNIVDYIPGANITILNRSEEKAKALAGELQLHYLPIEKLPEAIATADVLVVATSAPTPSITRKHLEGQSAKLVIDLSIPCNVEASVKHLPDVTLINVDELSLLNNATLHKRSEEIPLAKDIVQRYIAEFISWNQMRSNVPVLNAVKIKLNEINTCPLFTTSGISFNFSVSVTEKRIQKVINSMASKMRAHQQHGCSYIAAINEFIQP
ncbi:glutamyl-tRNA reductase [Filimonas lacunae]|uniref:Glutamyl-tRNA reductase n=1 Tax=Filimonas lacunae TaxID=477680 RepID=A0A173MGC4_9BACT|nr:glutamyl-tRNA reductase [Filimonas lacunae]BAV06674.1 glutamyl-tRNA reductase [Filimonas lacunae]SIT27860.1 glutamyl-tRNA reductase [Filimonas lacunae]